jgi:hypothetical protein
MVQDVSGFASPTPPGMNAGINKKQRGKQSFSPDSAAFIRPLLFH